MDSKNININCQKVSIKFLDKSKFIYELKNFINGVIKNDFTYGCLKFLQMDLV